VPSNNMPEAVNSTRPSTDTRVEAGPYVLREAAGGVVTLTLNRGERFNPLSSAMIAALQAELDAIAGDATVRVVVLAARGRGFCAGHDLRELRAHPDLAWQEALFEACGRVMMTLTEMPQPVIARVHGTASAAGCQLVSGCDLAVASVDATFSLPGVNIGVFCTSPAVGVARNIGRKRVMEMLLTGDAIDAATAQSWGLVNRVVPAAELDDAVAKFIERVVLRSGTIIALGKRAFYRQIEQDMGAAYAAAAEVMSCNLMEPDAHEGIDAFLAKRAPHWKADLG